MLTFWNIRIRTTGMYPLPDPNLRPNTVSVTRITFFSVKSYYEQIKIYPVHIFKISSVLSLKEIF
jgi:hypothetical protein